MSCVRKAAVQVLYDTGSQQAGTPILAAVGQLQLEGGAIPACRNEIRRGNPARTRWASLPGSAGKPWLGSP